MARKVILSRKGFDSSAGGKPSPIIDEQIISLPIPKAWSGNKYEDLFFKHKGKEYSYRRLLQDLNIKAYTECHLDPDLVQNIKKERNENNWSPAFGQHGSALSELNNVNKGDLFLFFGWFKEAELINGRFTYKNYGEDFHAIWAYLEIGNRYYVKKEKIPTRLQSHPHYTEYDISNEENNAIYTPASASTLLDLNTGSGVFKFKEKLILSANKSRKKSIWKPLPFLQIDRNSNRVKLENNLWNSGGRGQELIFELKSKKELKEWAKDLEVED